MKDIEAKGQAGYHEGVDEGTSLPPCSGVNVDCMEGSESNGSSHELEVDNSGDEPPAWQPPAPTSRVTGPEMVINPAGIEGGRLNQEGPSNFERMQLESDAVTNPYDR